MNVVVVFSTLAVVVLLAMLLVRRRSLATYSVEDMAGKAISLDVEGFKNLVAPSETVWLGTTLPGRAFRSVQRRRIVAALAYVSAAASNATLLMRVAESVRESQDQEASRAAQQLSSLALRVRFFAMMARLRLARAYVWPSRTGLLDPMLADRYSALVARFRSTEQLTTRAPLARVLASL